MHQQHLSAPISRRMLLAGASIGGLALATPTHALAAASALPPANAAGRVFASPFTPGAYLGQGTVFTRRVGRMPLAANSGSIAAYLPTQPSKYQGYGVVTSLNTTSYNLPIYWMDSSVSGCTFANFVSTDPRVTSFHPLYENTTGRIPLPLNAIPAGGGDMSFTAIDQATGQWREYFHNVKLADGSWNFAASGNFVAAPGFTNLASANYWMQCTQGSSSVVGMMNSLSQIGIAEARAGAINHALSFTIANASSAGYSFPARQSDGTDTNPNAPREGQWFRLPPTLDLASLGLRPFTLLIARAVQTYGGYAADKNLFCHAFNAEHPVNEMAQGKPNPWADGGDLFAKYATGNPGYKSIDVNDFPWSKTEWAPVGWDGRDDLTRSGDVWTTPIVIRGKE